MLLMVLAAPLPAQWVPLHVHDFETAMDPWTHTNGQAFPYGWGRQTSAIHPGWVPPNPGGWCLWIDSDATGQAGTADTAKSPAIPGDSCNPFKVKWGMGYEDFYSGTDFMQMLYRLRNDGQWQPWAVGRSYYADIVKADSLLVAQPAESLQVAFYYSDEGTWAGWACVDNIEITGFITGVEGDPTGTPEQPSFILRPSRPNPVRETATLSFVLSRDGPYSFTVYNISGQKIGMINGRGSAGHNEAVWNTRDVCNGVYLYRLATESGTAGGKLVVAR